MPQQPPAGPTLVLGVTPELTRALRNLVAVDRSQAMIARLWGGDSDAREALCADWLEMAPRRAPFVAAIGDGSLNVVAYPEQLEHLLRHLGALLIPGGRLAFRVFTRPERPIELSDLLALTSGPAMVNFHAFKWMLAMHLAAQGGGGVAVTEILRTFERHWPDRDLLAATTGWHRQAIDTIDVYRNADDRYGFPTRQEMLGRLPDCFRDAHYIETTGYDLAERCPILTCQRR